MWPRVAELLLAAWLVLTPWIFAATTSVERYAARDVAVGLVVILFSILSFVKRTEWAHLGTALLALGLGLAAYLGDPRPGPPGAQNEIVVALLLMLFAIVPNEAASPPRPWRRR